MNNFRKLQYICKEFPNEILKKSLAQNKLLDEVVEEVSIEFLKKWSEYFLETFSKKFLKKLQEEIFKKLSDEVLQKSPMAILRSIHMKNSVEIFEAILAEILVE